MDLGMQLSFSESFNIVTADFISQYVPIIVSPTISWMDDSLQVGTENLKQIVDKLKKQRIIIYTAFYYRVLH